MLKKDSSGILSIRITGDSVFWGGSGGWKAFALLEEEGGGSVLVGDEKSAFVFRGFDLNTLRVRFFSQFAYFSLFSALNSQIHRLFFSKLGADKVRKSGMIEKEKSRRARFYAVLSDLAIEKNNA